MYRDEADWVTEFQTRKAFWTHDGDPKRPHILLNPDYHADGFFDAKLIAEDPGLLNEAASDLVELVQIESSNLINVVDRVVGPALRAGALAHAIALHISQARQHNKSATAKRCLVSCTERKNRNDTSESGFTVFKGVGVRPNELVLVTDDVIVDERKIGLITSAVTTEYGHVAEFMTTLVNRSGCTVINSSRIVALVNRPIPVWKASECPLCRQGSWTLEMGGKTSWDLLNSKC